MLSKFPHCHYSNPFCKKNTPKSCSTNWVQHSQAFFELAGLTKPQTDNSILIAVINFLCQPWLSKCPHERVSLTHHFPFLPHQRLKFYTERYCILPKKGANIPTQKMLHKIKNLWMEKKINKKNKNSSIVFPGSKNSLVRVYVHK